MSVGEGVYTHRVFDLREEWLEAMVATVRHIFGEAGIELPSVRVSCSFALSGGPRVLGQCISGRLMADRRAQIAISPLLDNEIEVAGVLMHELIHACAPGTGHGKAFRDIAVRIGMAGKMTQALPGPELNAKLAELLLPLGPYPHARIDLGRKPTLPGSGTGGAPASDERPADAPPDQRMKGRLLKVSCTECGYPARVTRVWLAKVGPPVCPCNGEPMAITDVSPVAKAFKNGASAAS